MGYIGFIDKTDEIIQEVRGSGQLLEALSTSSAVDDECLKSALSFLSSGLYNAADSLEMGVRSLDNNLHKN